LSRNKILNASMFKEVGYEDMWVVRGKDEEYT
jgi:hypothetical protein